MLAAPLALLLDFGGVIVESGRSESAERRPRLVARVHELIGGVLTSEEIEAELKRADDLRSQRRNADLIELSPTRFWAEMVTDMWPERSREAVVARADELTYLWTWRESWRLRPGIAELLEHTVGAGLPVAVVSNTRCGPAHRDALDRFGVTGAFAVQIYSDELGFCKPHPEMIWAAARELDVPTSRCWFVGDRIDRDIECARRADAGAAILMPNGPVGEGDAVPDATVASGLHLLALLRSVAVP